MQLKMRLLGWPKVRFGMRVKLVLSFLVVILPAFSLLVVNDQRHYLCQQDVILQDSRAEGQAIVALVQANLAQAASIGFQILDSAWLAEGSPQGEALDRLTEISRRHPECLDVFVLDAQGQLIAATPPGREHPIPIEVLNRVASDEASAVVSDLYQSGPEGQPAVQVLVAGRSLHGFTGIAGVTLAAETLAAQIGQLAQGHPFSITLYDHTGRIICSSQDPEMSWEQRDWSRHNIIQEALQGRSLAIRGPIEGLGNSAYLGAALPVPGVGWAVTVWQPAQGNLADLRSRAANGLILFVSLSLVALVAAVMVGNWFTNPVVRLVQHAQNLGRGQLNERVDIRTGDELESLATALNNMARQLEERDRRLRARTAELDSIITQSADGIAIHGPEGELLRLNPAAIRILGRTSGRLGLSLAEQATWFKVRTLTGQPIAADSLPVAAALRGEVRVAEELLVETEAGQERVVAFSASPLIDPRGRIQGAVAILRDMTLARQAQQERDDFISIVSHELKTPITSIKGYAQMLLRRAEEAGRDERDLKGLRIINDEVDRMVNLINQLLDVSRLETRRLELNLDRVDLVSLASDTVDRLQMTTSRHTLRLRAPQEPIWVTADPLRLAQVLSNLLMNAIQYSPAGGPVEVTVEAQEGRAWVSVRDWGIGIAPEDQPRLFQRFYRGLRKGNASPTGMGLGLYISREIVLRHHGDIAFHSRPGQGSTFLFWLPLDNNPKPNRPPAS